MTLGRWISYMVLGENPPIRRRRERRQPGRDWRYRAFIRQHPCAVCGTTRGVECAHTGPHGLGIKGPDGQTIPLCWWHHWGSNCSLHSLGPAYFEKSHGLRIGALVKEYQSEWKDIQERRI